VKILIDVGHPAHVHLFKNLVRKLQNNGAEVLFTCRSKEHEVQLLKHYGFRFESFGRKYHTSAGKILGLFKFDVKECLYGIKFKPDLFLSHGSIYAAHAAYFLRKPHISLEDTGNREQVRLYLPFTQCVLTSDVFPKDYGDKQIRFKSHHELAYLHPNQFIPDPLFKEEIGLKPDEKYIIIRFVAWNATHDKGQKGIGQKNKNILVKKLAETYRVFISSEQPLPKELHEYMPTFPPHLMHDALFHSDLYIGEGTTMAMEAALLGTPAIYINSLKYSNISDLAEYGLIYDVNPSDNIDHILMLASDRELKEKIQQKHQEMLRTKIDLTAFMVWFIENYPQSREMVEDTEEFWGRFR